MTEQTDIRLTITYAGQSDVGMQRSENQDAFGKFPSDSNRLSSPKGQLFLLADGMGGHQRGREASDQAVKIIGEYVAESSDPIPLNLKKGFQAANSAIYKIAQSSSDTNIMGTTCVALLLTEQSPYVAHVGDSRIYRVNEEGIEQLTEDHSQVAEMLREGIITEEEAEEHPSRSVLSRALGIKPNVEVDVRTDIPLEPGSHFVLCSDGLSKVPRETIKEVVLTRTPSEACAELIRLANEAGGHDNITVQVIKVHERAKEPAGAGKTTNTSAGDIFRRIGVGVLLIGFVVIILYLLLWRTPGDVATTASDDESTARITGTESSEGMTDVERAQEFIRTGELDSALTLYRSVLQTDPMQMEALQGVRRISNLHREQGDQYLKQGDLERAIRAYEQAAALQPASQELKQLISMAREQSARPQVPTSSGTTEADQQESAGSSPAASTTSASGLMASAEESTAGNLNGPMSEGWQFPDLGEDAVTIEQSKLIFEKSPVAKKAIYMEDVVDVDIEVVARVLDQDTGRIGIIVGYQNDQNDEHYFLFTVETDNTYVLSRRNNEGTQQLLRINGGVQDIEPDEAGTHEMKVKVLGPWIMMYHNGKLLNGWLGEEIIEGKIGVYADADIPVEFSQFQMTSALDYEITDQSQTLEEQE